MSSRMGNEQPPKILGFLRQLLPQECTPTCRIARSLLCPDRQAGHHDEDDPPGHALPSSGYPTCI
ncbi:hypothetical protein BO78DRAFT_396049 [Aspergillus sclerotiicarbonarius CBS 121057]|uniref:Uncharacterized protein n=1 Tax=Aspergillus sclerotiicarbonarius (strain CBS 121057 / IBT 28362) TaxID=1448318 RepID=A0A319ECP3_ASPSB|nr:hypothetical protein BO78DRAFT_396049 [Aspergillus sclerotiicarbonarius CBS 121057]